MEFEKEIVMDTNFINADSHNAIWEQYENENSLDRDEEWDEIEEAEWTNEELDDFWSKRNF